VALSEKSKARAAAAEQLAIAEKRYHELRTQVSAVLEDERRSLEQGDLTAADLARAEAFRGAELSRIHGLELEVTQALERLTALELEVRDARSCLATAEANEKALERHHAEWEHENQLTSEQNAEEASLTVWTAKRYGPRRG
jgi:hypothetical protein